MFFCNRDIDVQAQFSVNQSRPEEITMREDLGSITLMGDDGFGESITFVCKFCLKLVKSELLCVCEGGIGHWGGFKYYICNSCFYENHMFIQLDWA